jgi:acetoin utilization deacetylase AcuC-like enzyme
MILYDENLRPPFREFGVLLPISADKNRRIVTALREDPKVGALLDRYLIGPDFAKIGSDEVGLAHTPEYTAQLHGDGLERALLTAFELIDETGAYYRYDPAIAVRPLSELREVTYRYVAGVHQACRAALTEKDCFFLGGGTHHARADTGTGFCLVNDTVIAIRMLQRDRLIRTAWIVDVDCHKGDGTACLTEGDDTIRTLSIHMAHGWPLDGPEYFADGRLNPHFTPSDIDIPVESDQARDYNRLLREGLDRLSRFERPDLVVVLSGVDPWEHDELPSTAVLKLTADELYERDVMLYTFLEGLGIPRAYLTAGGYGAHSWERYVPFLRWLLLRWAKNPVVDGRNGRKVV